jgi:hypothetical protein
MADFAGAEVRRTVGEITAKLRESAMHYRKIEPNWPGDVAEGQAVAVEDAALWIEREFGGAK